MAQGAEGIGRRAARTLYASLAGKFIALGVTTVTFLVIANLLGRSNYGLYTLAIYYASLVGGVSNFGVAAYFDRHISAMSYKKDRRGIARVLSNGFTILVPVALGFAALGVLLSGFVTGALHSQNLQTTSLLIVSMDLFFSMLWGAAYSALIGFGNGRGAAISGISINLIQLITGAGLVLSGFGVNGALLGLLLGDALGFFMMSGFIMSSLKGLGISRLPKPDAPGLYDNLRFSTLMGTYNFVTGGVISFATLYLGVFAASELVGDFGAALRALGVLTIVFGTLSSILIQAFSTVLKVYKSREAILSRYNKALDYSLLLNLPIIVFTGVFAQQIISILLHAFVGAPSYILLIAAGTSISVINYFMSSFLVSVGKVNDLLKYVLISVLIQLVAVLLLVPTYKAVGAIVAVYFIGNVVNLALFSRIIRREFGIRLQKVRIISMYVASIILGMIISAVHLIPNSYAQIGVGIIAVILLYPPLLVIFKGVDTGTLDEVREHVRGLPLMGKLMYWLSRYTSIFTRFFNTA